MKPKIGQLLYASCAGHHYGRILAVGKDANGESTIDIEVFHPNDMLSFDDDVNALTRLELVPNTKVILHEVIYTMLEQDRIICATPGNNCFRCTKLFLLNTEDTDVM